ncbi:MAG: DNA-directed RNA polymerase subunit alpha [Tissierellia bacterium]|nr:DNA-directed RNA polymerase subunit alpha [Tissierellia bacterium]
MTQELLSRIDIIALNENQDTGTFVFSPLDRGYGQTIGNSLRRVLLSSLEGASVTRVKFDGVQHEFSTLEGVREDVPEIILNLKEIACIMHTEEPIILNLEFKGPMDLKAGDFNVDADLEIVNPDQKIATLNEDAAVRLEIEFNRGKGYMMAEPAEPSDKAVPEEDKEKDKEKEEKEKEAEPVIVGSIPVDAAFSPVESVNFTVENTRVGKQTDFDRLEMEVVTNGTVKAQEALAMAASILIEHFKHFVDLPNLELVHPNENGEKTAEDEQLLETPIDAINLSLRSFNCLKSAGIDTVGDITQRTYEEMMKIKNFGKKSIAEVEGKLEEMGLRFAEETDEAENVE